MAEETELVFCKNCGNLVSNNSPYSNTQYCDNCRRIYAQSPTVQSFDEVSERWGLILMNIGGWTMIIATLTILVSGLPIQWLLGPGLALLAVVFIGRVLWDNGVEGRHRNE
jgi:hypothetical protein